VSTTAQTFDEDEKILNLRELFAKLWPRRWWIVATVLLAVAGATVIAFTMTRKYRAAVVVVPAAADRNALGGMGGLAQLGGLASLAGINLGGGNTETEEGIAVLKSRGFTEKFIQDHNLMPVLYAKRWDAAAGKWREGERPPTPAKAFKDFDSKIRSVVEDKKTGLITVLVIWRDREQAAQWANELVQRLNVEMRSRAIANTNASLGFLEKELEGTTTVATRDAISRLIEAQVKQRMLANVTQEYAFRVVDHAMPPDADDPVGPRKLVVLLAGALVGLVLGVGGVLLAGFLGLGAPRARSGE
jgi:uncharacterized protein involved in exopolysaccharide biosynthesis